MSAKIHTFVTEYWKLDGGSCFGVIPKTIWSKISTPNEHNLINIASRCLLIESQDKKVIVDTGIGNKFDAKFYSYFFRTEIKSASTCVQELGFDRAEITDVIFTHLHWDHIGGASFINSRGEVELSFPNANHWCAKTGWEWAMNPSPREKKAFFKADLLPILNSGKLKFIEHSGAFDENIELSILNGHTIGQLIPTIQTDFGTVVFSGDFIPSKAHIPIPYIPSQDIQPLVSMKEKEAFFEQVADRDTTLIFQHDSDHECCKLTNTANGIQGTASFIWKTVGKIEQV